MLIFVAIYDKIDGTNNLYCINCSDEVEGVKKAIVLNEERRTETPSDDDDEDMKEWLDSLPKSVEEIILKVAKSDLILANPLKIGA